MTAAGDRPSRTLAGVGVYVAGRAAAIGDGELVARACDGQGWAFAELAHRHADVIRAIVARYYLTGGDEHDLRQEALIGLWRACRDYDYSTSRSFRGFAAVCIERIVITALRTDQRRKHTPLNGSLRLEQLVEVGEDDELPVGECLAAGSDTATIAQHRQDLRTLRQCLPVALTPAEQTVLARVLNGATLQQAGQGVGTSAHPAKTADNALQRVRAKAQRLLDGEAA